MTFTINLITSENNLLKSVLYDNIRDYQGDQNIVNSEIASTLESDDANIFVVLNAALLSYIDQAKQKIEPIISSWDNEDDAKTVTIVDKIKSSINILYR